MKRIIVFLFIISLVFLFYKDDNIYIQNAIRYRIIANDDSIASQELKWKINNEIMPIINKMDASSKESMELSIENHINEIEDIVSKYTNDYHINYGSNYFPKKIYQNVVYDEGYYPSLVISLGNSDGHNWWCFMFPPLCTLEAQKEDLSEIEYDFYFKQIINKYL